MSKRIITAVLAASMLFSLASCNKSNPADSTVPTDITETTEETSATETTVSLETQASEESSAEETDESDETTVTSQTSASETTVIGKTTVTDQFKKTYKNENLGKVVARIPKVTIEGVDTSAVNKEILNKIKPEAKGNKCSYQYYIGKTYVSIFIELDDSGIDCEWHRIYNISRKTGKKLSQNEMYKVLGISASKYKSRVKKAIKKMWKKNGWIKGQKKRYNKAISKKTLNKAVLYVNKKGKLSYLVRNMDLGAGSDDGYDVFGTC